MAKQSALYNRCHSQRRNRVSKMRYKHQTAPILNVFVTGAKHCTTGPPLCDLNYFVKSEILSCLCNKVQFLVKERNVEYQTVLFYISSHSKGNDVLVYIHIISHFFFFGFFFDKTGSAVANSVICPIGQYCPEGTKVPISCAPGSYTNRTGMSACDICPDGYAEKLNNSYSKL